MGYGRNRYWRRITAVCRHFRCRSGESIIIIIIINEHEYAHLLFLLFSAGKLIECFLHNAAAAQSSKAFEKEGSDSIDR